ncbi:hypothetical protein NWE55_16830 (plasmid) [Myroides albus]|uniref:hypothetical protein n=1 Tax=Myroides albus TaxID=2562892 RepID=UPI0021594F25|nr:hypothetical protein [Myroides albus]UVD81337.1 hypothetical protein NWE55_16830 [Myroides albus]
MLENNPSFDHSNQSIDYIHSQVKDQVENLEPAAIKIVLSQFLALNYSNQLMTLIEDYLLDNQNDQVEEWKSLGIYKSEIATILHNISKDEILPNSLGEYDLNVIQGYIDTHLATL